MVSRLRIRNAFATMVAVMVLGFTATVTPAQAGYYEEGTIRASLGVGTGVSATSAISFWGPASAFSCLMVWRSSSIPSFGLWGSIPIRGESGASIHRHPAWRIYAIYLGGFYKHAFIKGLDDQDSVGFRLGLSWDLAPNIMASGGAVFEYDLGWPKPRRKRKLVAAGGSRKWVCHCSFEAWSRGGLKMAASMISHDFGLL